MITRVTGGVLMATLLAGAPVRAQAPQADLPLAAQFMDAASGLSLEQAVARAIDHEPSLRAARSQLDVAEGMRMQASLRPNPSVSFEQRAEPGGMDSQTTVEVVWPLDLFRRDERRAVADREAATVQLSVGDRERLLAAQVRLQYGEVLAAIRDLEILDQAVTAARQQHDVLRSRVDAGASPPLERDLLEVEVRRLESERLLQAGRTEASLYELKRLLGMPAGAALALRDTLESVVQREAAPLPMPADAGAADRRPDVREAATRVDLAQARLERAETENRPEISVFGSYMRMDAGFPQQAFGPDGSLIDIRGRFHYVAAGVMVTLPLLNRNQGDVAAVRAERAGAAASYEAARLAAESELAAARVRDARAREAVAIYPGARTLARQNLSVVTQSRELGRVSVFDVLVEQRRYLDVERGYTAALRDAYEARTALERALGGVR